MRFWVDIANSPHAPLFAPIVEELRGRGHGVLLTAWDRAQTRDLARSYWPDVRMVGSGSDRRLLDKALRIARRARSLAEAVDGEPIDVALGHNSYAQLLAARRLRIPAVTMMDYEHQPANHLAFRLAGRVIVPEAFPARSLRSLGAARKAYRYPGLKEEVALALFRPDPGFRASIGVDDPDVLVTLRPPPEGALYHRNGNGLFDLAVRSVVERGAVAVLSPRDEAQARRYRRLRVRVLERPVDGANLLFHSDAVVGAGGTMTREAGVLGRPSYTLFAGRPAAVDEALIAAGTLTRIESPRDIASIRVRRNRPAAWHPERRPLERVVGLIERAAGELCAR